MAKSLFPLLLYMAEGAQAASETGAVRVVMTAETAKTPRI
jgi:hypothetical protein